MALQWTGQVRQRVVEVVARCLRACEVLADAAEHLASPMHIAGDAPAAVRARLELLHTVVTGASNRLALAARTMEAVEHFAVRGAAASPVTPLASVQHVPSGGDPDHPVRLALSLLRIARADAEGACDHVERFCGYLRAIDNQLRVIPALLAGACFLDGEHLTYLRNFVKTALNLAKASTALAVTAYWLLVRR